MITNVFIFGSQIYKKNNFLFTSAKFPPPMLPTHLPPSLSPACSQDRNVLPIMAILALIIFVISEQNYHPYIFILPT